ncbi:amidohydrolase family protein [Leptospira sp. 96542]|nr:amidohydrolase family protein [Leptospira sp. 96542]
MNLLIQGGKVFQNQKLENKDIRVLGEHFKEIEPNLKPEAKEIKIDITGKTVLPGFINSHDHLLASYLPKVGGIEKHLSWLSYDNLYKSSGVFAERQQIDPELLYYLGAYKNLFSGVTTVFDHIPHQVQNPFRGILPIKLIEEYSLSHSIGTYNLNWGEGPALEYRMAEHANLPFVTHLGEGLDEDSKQSLKKLEKLNALGPHSVLVHCLPFGQKEVELIKEKGASVVWCPTSNLHIFGKTTNIKLFLDMGVNVCLGTDFSPSGATNLLEEIKFAKSVYEEAYGESLSELTLLQMITENPRKAFRMGNPNSILPGQVADFIVIRNENHSDDLQISNLKQKDIDLIVIDGFPIYGSANYQSIFSDLNLETENLVVEGESKIVVGSPKKLVGQVSMSVGYKKELAFLPNF